MEYDGLIFGCPKLNPNDSCPLERIRKLNPRERVDWWKSLSFEARNEIIRYHKGCTLCQDSNSHIRSKEE